MAESNVSTDEKLRIHQRLVQRIISRAVKEGNPLTAPQVQQFDSDAMSKEEHKKFSKEFERENDWFEFMARIADLLRSAVAEDAERDPEAPARYDAMVHALEDRPESFTLWACCVPAIPGYKSIGSRWPGRVVQVLVFLGIIYIVLHALKIF